MESPTQDTPVRRTIKIIIQSIKNIAVKEGASVSFIVIHNDIVLGETSAITIDHGFEESSQIYNVDFTVQLPIIINDRSSIDSVVSTPILIKMICNTQSQRNNTSATSIELKKQTKLYNQKQSSFSSSIIGFCNFDLMPILLGERSFTERLIVETEHPLLDDNATSWQSLATLIVTAMCDDEEIFPLETKINFLTIVVESIYNPPIFFTEDAEYKAGTIVYIDNKIPENLIFEDGKWTKYRDTEKIKRWRSLSKLQRNAGMSKCKLRCNYADIKNTLNAKLDLEKKLWKDEARIEWNFMNRSMIHDVGAQMMQERILRHKYWPFQFIVSEMITQENEIKLKEGTSTRYRLYQCYVDLSEFLSPGRKSTRVAAQLYTYDTSDMIEKTGLEKDIFHIDSWNQDLKEQKSKASESVSSDIDLMPSTPLTSESGEPVFVIIEVELYYPFIPCTLETDLLNIIGGMPKVTKSPYIYSDDMAEDQYATCIRKLVETITESYRDFREEKTREKSLTPQTENARYCFAPETDELTCFTQHLYKTGTYLAIRSTLKAKVIMLLDQKFKIDTNTVHSVDSQNFVASVYTYLVERMHLAINKIVESRLTEDLPKITIPEKLYFYAEEAYELGYVDDARRHYQTAIASNENDAEAWTKYAIFFLKIDDVNCAKECCHEAILSDRRDKIALLMYGLILVKDRKYEEAEIFFHTVIELYPRFTEGWIILHLFYIYTEYYPGIELTLRVAESCLKDENRETEMLTKEPLAWTMIHCPRSSIYMITATFLMKLHLCDFAGMALAEEVPRTGRSMHVLYYLAVQYYLLKRYEDALSHLREVECIYGRDYSVTSLIGHCHFQEGNFEEALPCYEFASMLFNKPDDLHLVQMRMGLYYEEIGDYESAAKVFLGASRISPTAETWLGVGVAFYELQRFTEAEVALIEANRIDNRNVNVWKYLCLLNTSLQRHDEFAQCYKQIAQANTVFSLEKRSLKPRERKPSVPVTV